MSGVTGMVACHGVHHECNAPELPAELCARSARLSIEGGRTKARLAAFSATSLLTRCGMLGRGAGMAIVWAWPALHGRQ